MGEPAVYADPSAEDARQLARANEIVELLRRAVKLGFGIVLSPVQMTTLIAILEDARLQKPERGSPND